MNFLEQLAAEWYAYRGYLVRTNVKFAKRKEGGYSGEMDVVAFHPEERSLVHIEVSMDADSWEERREKLLKRFERARRHYDELFPFRGLSVQEVVVAGWGRTHPEGVFPEGVTVKTPAEFVRDIVTELRKHDLRKDIVPEEYPVLRAMQMAIHWGGPERKQNRE